MTDLGIAALRALGARRAIADAPCPACGPDRHAPSNRTRKTLRIWDRGDLVSYCCARCGITGYAIDGVATTTKQRAPIATAATQSDTTERADLAATLWSKRRPARGSLVETYLRSRSCWVDSLAIGFLPPRRQHGPAMISRFGSDNVSGIHLTRLRPDGEGKAGTDKDKIMLGPSKGQPIVVHDNPERLDLVLTEGVEDGASFAMATGWSAWAAGSAGRIAALLPLAAAFENVFVAVDSDFAGRRALQMARDVRPDVIAIDFGMGADANDVLRQLGADAITSAIDHAFDKLRKLAADLKIAA